MPDAGVISLVTSLPSTPGYARGGERRVAFRAFGKKGRGGVPALAGMPGNAA